MERVTRNPHKLKLPIGGIRVSKGNRGAGHRTRRDSRNCTHQRCPFTTKGEKEMERKLAHSLDGRERHQEEDFLWVTDRHTYPCFKRVRPSHYVGSRIHRDIYRCDIPDYVKHCPDPTHDHVRHHNKHWFLPNNMSTSDLRTPSSTSSDSPLDPAAPLPGAAAAPEPDLVFEPYSSDDEWDYHVDNDGNPAPGF